VYPSDEFRSQYETNEPVFYASLVIIVFLFTAIVFFIFARFMEHRQSKLEDKAARAVAVVNSVFPEQIGQRLIAGGEQQRTGKVQLDSYFGSRNTKELSGIAKPMADLFMDTTVLFADIAGFTAWASTREPSQVFMLLESLYYQFDKTAQKRGIFKVETIGDSYVAAAGLPTPRTDHYIAMAKFAGDIMDTMDMMTQQLEVDLGPDTSSLGLRIGLNSGAVTAGVLRGDRARFQLFGDTVNTAARMESTGACGRIQISQSTADLLAESGKSSWFIARQDKVDAKGKGLLQTYWLLHRHSITDNDLHGCSTNSTADSADSHSSQNLGLFMDPKKARLVNWNVEILSSLLLKLTNQRRAAKVDNSPATVMKELESNVTSYRNVLDEVVEVMDLKCPEKQISLEVPLMEPLPELDPKVYSQLKLYVASIASMYHDNPFHSFEHASHVTMSVIKLMNRIIAHPNDYVNQNRHHGKSDFNECIFGDVLTQFSVAFSALLHDVDHSGVTNATLVQEQTEAAILYGNKSVAEQNSIDVAWHLLMENDFVDLRQAIYVNKSEFLRFRQLVVNTILATDIMDKDLKQLREERWLNAFHTADASMCKDACNRKATIIIEHLIQASDVAHTMQHFHIYKKWNEQLFMEMHKAYKDGKTDNDPSDGWYKGELGFFDFYIIPLAKKLDICGVFGVSSHEYLSYAKQNRMEWESKGLQIVEEYKAKAAKEFG
jgi:class 3 adenylate cyclase